MNLPDRIYHLAEASNWPLLLPDVATLEEPTAVDGVVEELPSALFSGEEERETGLARVRQGAGSELEPVLVCEALNVLEHVPESLGRRGGSTGGAGLVSIFDLRDR